MFVLNIDGAGDTLASFGKGQGGSVPPYAGPCGATCGLSVYLNGDTSGHWFARHLGCSSTPTAATFGTPVAANLRNDYSGCSSHPGVGVSTYSITGGGHVWCMTASNTLTGCTPTSPEATNGFEMSQVILDWFAATTGF